MAPTIFDATIRRMYIQLMHDDLDRSVMCAPAHAQPNTPGAATAPAPNARTTSVAPHIGQTRLRPHVSTPRPQPRKPAVQFPFTDAYVRALPRRTPDNQPTRHEPLTTDQQKVVASYYAFSLHEGRETWRRVMNSASGTFAARRYVGDLQDADLAATEALVECCRRWPLPCPTCAGRGNLRDSLRGATWQCGACGGSGKPRNDFTAFHAYLRQAVNQKVLEEVNRLLRLTKGVLDYEAEATGGVPRRNGKLSRAGRGGEQGTMSEDSAVGHVWPGSQRSLVGEVEQPCHTIANPPFPIHFATADTPLPRHLRERATVDTADHPPTTALWALADDSPHFAPAYTQALRACPTAPMTWPTVAARALSDGLLILAPATMRGRVQSECVALVIVEAAREVLAMLR